MGLASWTSVVSACIPASVLSTCSWFGTNHPARFDEDPMQMQVSSSCLMRGTAEFEASYGRLTGKCISPAQIGGTVPDQLMDFRSIFDVSDHAIPSRETYLGMSLNRPDASFRWYEKLRD